MPPHFEHCCTKRLVKRTAGALCLKGCVGEFVSAYATVVLQKHY